MDSSLCLVLAVEAKQKVEKPKYRKNFIITYNTVDNPKQFQTPPLFEKDEAKVSWLHSSLFTSEIRSIWINTFNGNLIHLRLGGRENFLSDNLLLKSICANAFLKYRRIILISIICTLSFVNFIERNSIVSKSQRNLKLKVSEMNFSVVCCMQLAERNVCLKAICYFVCKQLCNLKTRLMWLA